MKPALKVAILYGSKGKGCQPDCGIDWASKEAIELAKEQVKGRFGDRVKLEHTNLLKPEASPELHKLIKKEKLTLPVLLIDGQPRISGEFDFRLMMDAIDAELEMGMWGWADE